MRHWRGQSDHLEQCVPGVSAWGYWRLDACESTAKDKRRGLQTHLRLKEHHWHKQRAHTTERKEIEQDKREEAQNKLPKVRWGNKEIKNYWQFPYLGSLFQPDASQIPDLQARCDMAKLRAGSLRHVWAAELPLDLKLRLYISCCCSILVYGSEAWN